MSKAKEDAVKKVTTTEAVKKPTGNEKLKTSEKISKWWRELKAELKKVVWPTRKQTMTNTGVALVVTILAGLCVMALVTRWWKASVHAAVAATCATVTASCRWCATPIAPKCSPRPSRCATNSCCN